jgi:hypothetical protein
VKVVAVEKLLSNKLIALAHGSDGSYEILNNIMLHATSCYKKKYEE